MMFSATFPVEIQRLAADFLNDWIFLRVGKVGSTTEFIVQKVMNVPESEKKQTLLELIKSVKGLTLVFVETKRSAEVLDTTLFEEGFSCTSIHGDRSQREREEALNNFKTGKKPILIATDVASRGLDIPNVLHVINYDMPNNIESYIHRIGRTGRAGNSGLATAFMNEDNANIASQIIQTLEDTDQEVPDWLVDMDRGNRGGGGRSRGRGGGNRFGGRDFRSNMGRGRGGGGDRGGDRDNDRGGSGGGYGGSYSASFGGGSFGGGGYGGGYDRRD